MERGTLSSVLCAALVAVLIGMMRWRRRHRLPPGPRGWPILGSWLLFPGGVIVPRSLAAVARTYGDVCLLQIGCRRVVVVSSPEAAEEVLQTRGREFGSRSRNFVVDMTSGGGQDMVFCDYGAHWRRMRRVATLPFFSTQAYRRHAATWEQEIDAAVADLQHAAGGVVSGVRKRLQLAIYNMLYRMAFDRRFHEQHDPAYVAIEEANTENGVLAQSFTFNVAEFFPPLRIFFRSFLRRVRRANQHRHRIFQDLFIKDHMQSQSSEMKRRSGVDVLLEAESKGEINRNNVLYLLQNLNVGALGTTTSATKWAIVELVNHPEVQAKIYQELSTTLGDEVSIKEEDIWRLPYLLASVKEILRMHMPIPMLVPHRNLEWTTIGDYEIPPDCRVIVNAWGIANDPRFWEHPERFCPDRFILDDNHPTTIEPFGSDFRYLPFGSGRRSCPGSRMAFTVLALTVAKLVQSFELLPPPGEDQIKTIDYTGQLANIMIKSMSVFLKARKP